MLQPLLGLVPREKRLPRAEVPLASCDSGPTRKSGIIAKASLPQTVIFRGKRGSKSDRLSTQ